MLICLDCGKVLKNVKFDYSEESLDETIICPICESDNIWNDKLEMYVNDGGTL